MGTRIKDIAEKANVSISAVSLVLNNKPGVSDETRRRVYRIASEMNYDKNKLSITDIDYGTIRFLQIARHGHTINRDHNVFISEYIEGIVQRAKDYHYKIEITTFKTTPIGDIVSSLVNQDGLSGAIVLGTELSREDVMAFNEVSIPLVFIDTFLEYVPFDFVDMNNEDSVFTALEYFASHGHREIGIVRSSVQTRNFQLRFSAFKNAMEFLGHSMQDAYICDVDSTFDGAYLDMRKCLSKNIQLPTALFCTNDIIAMGVIKAIREAGIRVPEDISIIGFDDLPSAELFEPPLTTIAVSKREIGSSAMMRLAQRIDSIDLPPAKIVIGGTIMERGSVQHLSTLPTN